MATVNKKNIQGDIWYDHLVFVPKFSLVIMLINIRPRLPKKVETFVFFRITRADVFKKHMSGLVPFLTTADDAFKMREDIYQKKAAGTLKGLVKLSAINVALSASGLQKVCCVLKYVCSASCLNMLVGGRKF